MYSIGMDPFLIAEQQTARFVIDIAKRKKNKMILFKNDRFDFFLNIKT